MSTEAIYSALATEMESVAITCVWQRLKWGRRTRKLYIGKSKGFRCALTGGCGRGDVMGGLTSCVIGYRWTPAVPGWS